MDDEVNPWNNSSDDISELRLSVTSLESLDLFCEPCLAAGEYFDVVGYCEECFDYLCEKCFRVHNIPLPSRNHRLLDKHQMPRVKPTQEPIVNSTAPKSGCLDKCYLHGSRVVEYFCAEHDKFECTVCVTLKHRTCKIEYIPSLAGKFIESKEYLMIKHALESLSENTKRFQKTALDRLDEIRTTAETNLGEIRKFRKQLDEFFDELEKDVLDKLQETQSMNKVKINGLIKQADNLLAEIKRVQSGVMDKEHTKQYSRIYVERIQIQTKIETFEAELADLEKDTKVNHEHFQRSSKLVSCFYEKSIKFGTFVSMDKFLKINEDQTTITDIDFLSERKMVALDYFKNSVNVVDTKCGKVVMSLPLTDNFWRLAKFMAKEFLLFSGGTIEIYAVSDKIKLRKTIENVKLRWPIVYSNGVLIGITEGRPYKVRTANLNGDILSTMAVREKGKNLLRNPWSIAVNSEQTSIYISDCKKRTVTFMTFDGEVKSQYKPKGNWEPRGMAVSRDGTVYVCDHMNNNIVVLTSELETVSVILGDLYDLRHPGALTYCDKSNKLCVAESGGQVLTILNV